MGEYVARHAAPDGVRIAGKPRTVAFRLEAQCWRNRRAGLPVGRHRAVERAGVSADRRVVMWGGSDG